MERRKISKSDFEKLFERDVVAEVLPSKKILEQKLKSTEPFRIYFGIDATSSYLHLGHVQNLLFLEDLRKLGVEVIVLFGTFTTLIGDPTGKTTKRPEVKREDVLNNIKNWKKQIKPVLNMEFGSGVRIMKNNTWFDNFSFEDFLRLSREITIQQLIERDSFEKRIKNKKPLFVHEAMYPILQAYDSVAMGVDAELCGTDQTFNALLGSTFVRRFLQKDKVVITTKLIEANGVMMSKSNGTGVFVDMQEGGNYKMFGGIMALADEFIIPLFKGCTRVSIKEIKKMKPKGVNARTLKLKLANEIVSIFWGKDKSKEAEISYIEQFSKKKFPSNAQKITIPKDSLLINVLAKETKQSKAELKRKFSQGAVYVNGKKINDISFKLKKGRDETIKIGRIVFKIKK